MGDSGIWDNFCLYDSISSFIFVFEIDNAPCIGVSKKHVFNRTLPAPFKPIKPTISPFAIQKLYLK